MSFLDKAQSVIKELEPIVKKFISDGGTQTLFMGEAQAILAESLKQADLNSKNADSTNWFDRDWRPAIGWICGAGLVLHFIIIPVIMVIQTLFGHIPIPIPFDLNQLSNLIYGLLGLGSLIVAKECHQAHIDSKKPIQQLPPVSDE